MPEEELMHNQRRGARGQEMGCAIILIARLLLVQHEALQTTAAQCSAADQADQKKNQTGKRTLSNLRGGTLLHLAHSCSRMNMFMSPSELLGRKQKRLLRMPRVTLLTRGFRKRRACCGKSASREKKALLITSEW